MFIMFILSFYVKSLYILKMNVHKTAVGKNVLFTFFIWGTEELMLPFMLLLAYICQLVNIYVRIYRHTVGIKTIMFQYQKKRMPLKTYHYPECPANAVEAMLCCFSVFVLLSFLLFSYHAA